ncbi:hypothetical protein HW555_011474, partial [Spodoptera exigua]
NVQQSEGLSSEGKANKAKTAEPNIDFELDVKVYINSGKCVLHTKEPSKEDDSIKILAGKLIDSKDVLPARGTTQACACAPPARARPHRVPRARPRPQGTVYPDLRRKPAHARHLPVLDLTVFRVPGLDLKVVYPDLRRKPAHARHLPVLDLTVFRVPGLDLKVQYIPTYAASLRMRATCPCSTSPCSACPASTSRYSISRPTPQACACAPPARARPHRVPRARPRPQGTVYPDLRRKPAHARHLPVLDLTVFRVPGLDLKVHYESKTLPEESTSPQTVPSLPPLNVGPRKVGIKKAALFAWITVQSIPEETIISPHILEFLEQTLEPIPTKASFSTPTPEAESGSRSRSAEGASYGQYVYASFPVDVIVHFHMQPSTFRFSCLPASRVECMLQLPTLQIVFSSKRASDEEMSEPAVAMGGLSVTGCLADFSVNMFHPYGGKKSSLKEAQWSPLSDTERKDSLSINVEFVKFHLSRSRKLDFQTDQDQSKATVRFSTIVDVGSASFKYDMRRLGEILAFPKAWYRRTIVRRMFLGDLSLHDTRDHGRPSSSNAPVSPVLPQREKTKTVDHQKPKESTKSGVQGAASVGAAWETLVLFAVNFTKLNVHMNMGNVMGNVSWQSRDFNCTGRLSIGSTGHRNMLVGVALAGSELDARGGIVGGAICLSSIDTYVHIEEEAGCNPGHVCGVRLAALELRLEYMGTPVLLARVSALRARATDEWLARARAPRPRPHPPTSRPAIILTHGKLSWHQLQILMSRSTTPDLLKMQLKLEEFFTQQFKSSKRVFSSLHPNYTNARRDRRERTVLGGTMELHGTNISLACFHGNSFKAKSWALFSLKDPSISFATEAQQVASEDAIELFPSLEREAAPGPAGSERKPAADKHVREVIFALPSLQLHLRTHHLQANTPPTETDEKPVVECSFITEFEDHIFVSVDAEAFLFLHDLISSYIKEKDRVMPGATRGAWVDSTGAGPSGTPRPRPEDYRDYRCVTWHLEPTVRLLSWAGKSIEPYGVDYILQKLGFSHARTTIPKWLQRGTLDPLDKLLSLVLLRLVAIVPHK